MALKKGRCDLQKYGTLLTGYLCVQHRIKINMKDNYHNICLNSVSATCERIKTKHLNYDKFDAPTKNIQHFVAIKRFIIGKTRSP